MANVLLVYDNDLQNYMLSREIGRMGHYVRYVSNLKEGLEAVRDEAWDLVILGETLPDGCGLGILPQIRSAHSGPEVIMVTRAARVEVAELAIRMGASAYIEKEESNDRILRAIKSALDSRTERAHRTPPGELKRDRIVGKSKSLKACLALISEAASTAANVLLTGETGTGKELLAEVIHQNSSRADSPFVVVDCTSLPETLIESVLFGHEKGAFTGAFQPQEGLFKQADGGTLFLDEVGELPLSHQKAFLRVLQERRFRPIGSQKEQSSDFRVVAATNRNLEKMAQEGGFRRDLLYRLRSLVIVVPPLRERAEDIPAIADYYMRRFCTQYNMEPKQFSRDFSDTLASYDWPGNVRELINALEHAIAGARQDRTLYAHHLPIEIRLGAVAAAIAGSSGHHPSEETARVARVGATTHPLPLLHGKEEGSEAGRAGASQVGRPPQAAWPTLRSYLLENEKRYLQELLTLAEGNIMAASRISGVSRARLYVHLKKHGLASSSQSRTQAPEGDEGDAEKSHASA